MQGKSHYRDKHELATGLLLVKVEWLENIMAEAREELAENICQSLNSIKMMLAIQTTDQDQKEDMVQIVQTILRKVLADIKQLSSSFSKDWPEQFNVVRHLKKELQRRQLSKQVLIRPGRGAFILPAPPTRQYLLFRILQEIIQQRIAMIRGTRIIILIRRAKSRIIISMNDESSERFDKAFLKTAYMRPLLHHLQLTGGSIRWRRLERRVNQLFISLPLK